MSKKIDIEYCGSWGFKGPAARLKNILQQAFPNHPISTQPASAKTSRIEVKIVEGENKNIVWSDTKINTEQGHEIIK